MKNLFKYAIAAVTALAVVTMPACTNDGEDDNLPPVPTVTLSGSGFELDLTNGLVNDAMAGMWDLTVALSNVEDLHAWNVEVVYPEGTEEADQWISLTVDKVLGTVSLVILPNDVEEDRTATLVVSAEGVEPVSIPVKQLALVIEPSLECAACEGLSLDNLGGETTMTIDAVKLSWNLVVSPVDSAPAEPTPEVGVVAVDEAGAVVNWLQLSATSGEAGSTRVTVTVLPNKGADREAVIKIVASNDWGTLSVPVFQKGAVAAATLDEALAAAMEANNGTYVTIAEELLVYAVNDKGLVLGNNTSKLYVSVANSAAKAGDKVEVGGLLGLDGMVYAMVLTPDEVTVKSSGNTVPTVNPIVITDENAYMEWLYVDGMATGAVSPTYIEVAANCVKKTSYIYDEEYEPIGTVDHLFISNPNWLEMSQWNPHVLGGESLFAEYVDKGVKASGWAVMVNTSIGMTMTGNLSGLSVLFDKVETSEKIVLPPSITIDNALVNMPAAGGTNSDVFVIISNQEDNELSVSCDNNHFTVNLEPYSSGSLMNTRQMWGGSGNSKSYLLVVTASANEGEKPITGKITISVGEATETLDVKQAGKIVGTEKVVVFSTLYDAATPVPFNTTDPVVLCTTENNDEIQLQFSVVSEKSGYQTGWHYGTSTRISGLSLLQGDKFTVTSKSGNVTIKRVELLGSYINTTNFSASPEGDVGTEEVDYGTHSGYAWTWTGNNKAVELTHNTNKYGSVSAVKVIYQE